MSLLISGHTPSSDESEMCMKNCNFSKLITVVDSNFQLLCLFIVVNYHKLLKFQIGVGNLFVVVHGEVINSKKEHTRYVCNKMNIGKCCSSWFQFYK